MTNNYKHEAFQKAYPNCIKSVTKDSIIWKDGTEMKINVAEDGTIIPIDKIEERSFSDKLDNPTLFDQISIPYVKGERGIELAKEMNYDPGRIRYDLFFKKMYGSTKEEVEQNLVEVEWLPNSFKKKYEDGLTETYKLPVTKINNVDYKIQSISNKLDTLVTQFLEYEEYLDNPGGTFNWRDIAGTNRISCHSFGMTIDINIKNSNYWLWDYESLNNVDDIKEKDVDPKLFPPYHNAIPLEIVKVFEEDGFIWGGNWYHYDTMHFEYRPELTIDLIGEGRGN